MPLTSDELLRQISDREEIKALKFKYCRHADRADVDGMLSVFTDDCVAIYRPEDGDECRGVESLRKFYAKAQSVVTSSSHHLSNIEMVFQTPDRVAMYSYLYSWQRFTGYPTTKDRHRWARYEDIFVRTPEGWRQSELRYLVAGELSSDSILRSGEVMRAPFWTG